ncbi:MAG: DUF4124 domain-containing protein [Gammaproteobacteria bacterium]|nr:DUF4124 domain-containing protein [Gammaproteobacteria bacterium]
MYLKLCKNLFCLLPALLLISTPAQAGTIKKWVDENGVTHYGTSVPPRYAGSAHSELNERGIEVKRHDRALTEAEIEREKALEALRAEQQALLAEQQARDRILLNLYRNEDDLIMARNGKIAQIDSQIVLNHSEIRRMKTRLSEFQAVAAAAERSGRQLNATQKANLESTQRSIQKAYAIILSKEDEKRATIERYEIDLQRFRKLRQGGKRTAGSDAVRESEYPDLVDTAVNCSDPATCDRLWQAAQNYARKHATTSVDLAAERILVTAPPRELRDVSITVSRLGDREGSGERIFMDVQCVDFTEGREFCRGPQVDAIRNNFKAALGVSPAVETGS